MGSKVLFTSQPRWETSQVSVLKGQQAANLSSAASYCPDQVPVSPHPDLCWDRAHHLQHRLAFSTRAALQPEERPPNEELGAWAGGLGACTALGVTLREQ